MSSDEESVRVVDPLGVVALDGRWYLDGYCHRAGDMRRFRVDRVLSVRPTGVRWRVPVGVRRWTRRTRAAIRAAARWATPSSSPVPMPS